MNKIANRVWGLVAGLLILVGQGVQAQELYVSGNMYNAGDLFVAGALHNSSTGDLANMGNIHAAGNIENDGTTNYEGTMHWVGTAAQTVSGTQVLQTKHATFNNAEGVTLSKSVSVKEIATFTGGIVTAATATEPLAFNPEAAPVAALGVSDDSHVNGYVSQTGSTGPFAYPVGDGNKYQRLDFIFSSNDGGLTVAYKNGDAGAGSFTDNGKGLTALAEYNTKEYWDVVAGGNAQANVIMYYDPHNPMTIADVADVSLALKVADGSWNSEGGTIVGSLTDGRVTVKGLSAWGRITLGSASPITGIEDIIDFESFSAQTHIYPTILEKGETLNILAPYEHCKATVYDLLGRQVSSHTLQKGSNRVSLGGSSNGMHVVQVEHRGRSLTQKIVIK